MAAGGQRPLQGGSWCGAARRGWDHSISLASDTWRRPVPERLEGLPDDAWTDIGMEEKAIFATHRPAGWDAEQHCVVVRRRAENGQGLLVPHHTAILVSRDDLPLADLVGRRRGKQGPALTGRLENAFKGPFTDLDLHHLRAAAAGRTRRSALGWIAQALLRAVQFTALPKRARRHGLRPVIRHVMRTAASMVRSARRLRVRFARTNFRLDWLCEAMESLEPRAPPTALAA